MPAQKNVRLQAENLLRNVTVQNRKSTLSYQWKGVFLYEILGFPSLSHCSFDFYEKNIKYLRKVEQC